MSGRPRGGRRIALAILILSGCCARAGVVQLPTSRIIELRDGLQAELRGEPNRSFLDKAISFGVGRARTGLIAVEEASTYLDSHGARDGGRIRRVMGFAERILDDTTLNDAERITLRGYLNFHLKLFTAHRPRAAIQMLYRHRLWDAEHVPYLIDQVDDLLGRRQTYRALVDLRPKMTDVQLAVLRERLRPNPYSSLEKLAMLDEFDELDPSRYANFVKRLQVHFCNPDGLGGWQRTSAQEIKLRALLRLQTRLQRKDPAALRAFVKASGRPGIPLGATFFRKLGAGEFAVTLSEDTFRALDPLGLTAVPPTNVVAFTCKRRLDSH